MNVAKSTQSKNTGPAAPGVMTYVAQIEERIAMIREKVVRLEDDITEILSPCDNGGVNTEEARPQSSPMIMRLLAICDRLGDLDRTLDNLISRVTL